MNCDTEFRTASFAGIEFEILPSDHSGGRRIQTHEYPFRDEHYNEDLGRSPLKWSVKGMFVGDGWRDRLREAKEKWQQSGAAEFFDPTENRAYQAVLLNWSFSYDSNRLNAVEFSLELVEKGLEPYLNIGGSVAYATSTILQNYLTGVSTWYKRRFDLYGSVAAAIRAYDSVRGYLRILMRQFMGLGSLLNVRSSLDAMTPGRSAQSNFDQAVAVFEAAAQAHDDGGSGRHDAFYRAASEVRLSGNSAEQDQAHMIAAVALGYLFEAVAADATLANVAEFRTRADALKASANDATIQRLVDGLIASIGGIAQPACVAEDSGAHHALAASHAIYGDISRASEIMRLSGGVSGASMNGIVYSCPA